MSAARPGPEPGRDPVLVVLAAGASRRLGSPKALADLGGRTGLERLLQGATAAGMAERVVVAGRHADAIERALEQLRSSGGPSADCVVHPDWRAGRTGSVAAAARLLPDRALLIAPVDVPLVQPSTFASLLAGWRAAGAPESGWAAPFLEASAPRRFGHPLVLGAELAARTTQLPPDRPLRELRAEAAPLLAFGVRDAAILDDLDTLEDLQRLRERISRSDPA